MIEKLTNTRQQIDRLARMAQTLKEKKVEKGPGIIAHVMTDETADCSKSLLYAKAHLGKFLGVVKVESIKEEDGAPTKEPLIDFEEVARACYDAEQSEGKPEFEDVMESIIEAVKSVFDNPHVVAQNPSDEVFMRTARSFWTPYANEGTRKEASDIEPTSDKTEFTEEDWGDLNHIEKVDVLRQGIGQVCEEIMEIKQEKTTQEGNIHTTAAFVHACEARFALGFELERIKNLGA